MKLIVGLFLLPVGLILMYFGYKYTKKEFEMGGWARNGINLILFSVGVFVAGLILTYHYFS